MSKQLIQKFNTALGSEVKRLRTALDLSQSAFADLAKIPQSHLAAIETGKQNLTVTTLLRIASAFKKSLVIKFE